MSSISQRLIALSIAASAIVSAGCNDGLLHAPAQPEALVSMSVSASLTAVSGGDLQAFNKVDQLFLRFSAGGVVRTERTIPFSPSSILPLRISVPVRAATEVMSAELELRRGGQALFRGTANPTLSTTTPTTVALNPVPVVASVNCGTAPVQINRYGLVASLTGAALYASGDTVTSAPVSWTAASPAVSVAEDGQLIALQDGSAVATCAAGGFSATRTITVQAVQRTVVVDPLAANIVGGNPVTFGALILDSLGNVIGSQRPILWSSNNNAVATVSATGLVTGGAGGATRIAATSGLAVGSSPINSIVISPLFATPDITVAATGISGTTATLMGSVNMTSPNSTSFPVQAWFDYDTDPALRNPTSTPRRPVPSGTAHILIADVVNGLTPGTTYFFRVVTFTNNQATAAGAILSFRTPSLPAATTVGQDVSYTRGYALRGQASPNGSPTLAWFDWGTSATLATFSRTVQQPIGNGTAAVTVRHVLPALQPSTTYYGRLVTSSIGGTSVGDIVPFTTAAAAP